MSNRSVGNVRLVYSIIALLRDIWGLIQMYFLKQVKLMISGLEKESIIDFRLIQGVLAMQIIQ